MPEPDCFLRYRISAGKRNFTSGKSDVYVFPTALTRGFTIVLFTEPVSRRNTFVGGTCAPPSALLVVNDFQFRTPPFRPRHPLPLATGPQRRYSCVQCREFFPKNEVVRRAASRRESSAPTRSGSSPRGSVRSRTAPGRKLSVTGSEELSSRALRLLRRRHLSVRTSVQVNVQVTWIYIAPYIVTQTQGAHGMDHTVLSANYTIHAAARWRHHWLQCSHLIAVYCSLIDHERMKGWVAMALLADLWRTVYPRKWLPVICRSSAGQGKFAGQRPTFYHRATQKK